jgi:hypothetical protein
VRFLAEASGFFFGKDPFNQQIAIFVVKVELLFRKHELEPFFFTDVKINRDYADYTAENRRNLGNPC